MKRRDFIAKGAQGILGLACTGFLDLNQKIVEVKQKYPPIDFETMIPKPAGTMPMGEIGKTGIKVSKLGFGSHMRKDIVKYAKEREFMVREAIDLGMNFFDVYDHEQNCYQYEPMGRYLAPVINNVIISIGFLPYDGRSFEQEFERDLRLFGKDCIDMVRIHSYTSDSKNWWQWEKLFKYKEEGKIRAVGIPIHSLENIKEPLEKLPLDYVILPYNFYHNWTWFHKGMVLDNYDALIPKLRSKGVGVVSMKALASDWLIYPFKILAKQFDTTGEVNMAKACLRYVLNSGINVDSTIVGMFYPYQLYENVDAYFNPAMSDQERIILKKVRETAKVVAKHFLPPHYRFLEEWAPESWDDSDLFT